MFDLLKDHLRELERGLPTECLNSTLTEPLGRLVKAHLKKPVERVLEQLLKEALEKLFEEPPRELQERRHRPCRWH